MAAELIEICRIKEFTKGFEFGPHATYTAVWIKSIMKLMGTEN